MLYGHVLQIIVPSLVCVMTTLGDNHTHTHTRRCFIFNYFDSFSCPVVLFDVRYKFFFWVFVVVVNLLFVYSKSSLFALPYSRFFSFVWCFFFVSMGITCTWHRIWQSKKNNIINFCEEDKKTIEKFQFQEFSSKHKTKGSWKIYLQIFRCSKKNFSPWWKCDEESSSDK